MEVKNGLILAGVLLCFLISLSFGQETKDPQDIDMEDDSYSYDDTEYDEYGNDNDNYVEKQNSSINSLPNLSATTPTPTTTHVTTTKLTTTTEEIDLFADICPPKCECSDGIQFVNCSNRNFTEIPDALPASALTIDLSYNLINKIPSWIFENCTRTRTILLNNNHLVNITDAFITENHRLDYLDLSSNNITTIMPDTFKDAVDLTTLKLNYNPIELPKNYLFLNIPELTDLNMTGCNLTNVYNETFIKFSQLISLDLRDNPFDEDINVFAFEPMKYLQNLKFTSMPQKHIHELCSLLSAIDVISSDRYEISCFYLIAGATFEDSTLTIAPPKQKVSLIDNDDDEGNQELFDESITEPIIIPPKKQELINEEIKSSDTNTNNKQTLNNDDNNEKSKENDIINQNFTNINNETTMGNDVSNVQKVDASNSVKISSQTLKTILIGTIGAAIIGLIIGIICRRDVCGIKTKMCRRRRPLPTDQIRPAEQVPLNKVATS